MTLGQYPVRSVDPAAENTFVLTFTAAELSRQILPGQFVNIRVDEGTDPLLRRPFSVYRTTGDEVAIIFNVIGKGTALLRNKRKGQTIDVLGPLGVPFSIDSTAFDTAILVGGGLGVAPLPLATSALKLRGKRIETFLGARSASYIPEAFLENLHIATDDGTKGHHGNVVELLRSVLSKTQVPRPMIFGCGPTAMLRALAQYALDANIPCEVSLEGPMACGFGICQGCPVELVGAEKKYGLMCKDGPTFDIHRIKL